MSIEPKPLHATKVLARINRRFYRALEYLSIFAFILVVYGSAVLFDYVLFNLMWYLLRDDVNKYPIVAQGFDYARVGLALLFIASAVVHGILSTITQIQLDIKLAQEGNEEK
jgi:hypothetical protein